MVSPKIGKRASLMTLRSIPHQKVCKVANERPTYKNSDGEWIKISKCFWDTVEQRPIDVVVDGGKHKKDNAI